MYIARLIALYEVQHYTIEANTEYPELRLRGGYGSVDGSGNRRATAKSDQRNVEYSSQYLGINVFRNIAEYSQVLEYSWNMSLFPNSLF